MPNSRFSMYIHSAAFSCYVFVIGLMCAPAALAQETVLYSFNNTTGYLPYAGVTLDQNGDLFGTTIGGGNLSACPDNGGCGVAYEIVHNSDGTWTDQTLYVFTGGTADGAFPENLLTIDSRGHIFGTTYMGGNGPCIDGITPGCGTVFELVRNSNGVWTESVIYNFQGGSDGAYLQSNLTFDAQGNLYGTTSLGGSATPCVSYSVPTGCGTVFKLSPNRSGGWAESVLYSFKGGADGDLPGNGVVFDGNGILFGSAGGGLSCNQYLKGADCGMIFKLRRTSAGWIKTTPYRFKGGTDGFGPMGNLVTDASGNLYGTTYYGGTTTSSSGYGTVYELTLNGSGGWNENILYRLAGLEDGCCMYGGVALDPVGNLYGIASVTNGQDSAGAITFKLSPGSSGWTKTALATAPNEYSYGGASLDSGGNVYGTFALGGTVTTSCPVGCGLVFQVIQP